MIAVGVLVTSILETIWQISKIIKLIKHFNVYIGKRVYFFRSLKDLKHSIVKFKFIILGSRRKRSALIINRLVKKVELMSKLIYFVLVKLVSPSTIVSPLLVTFINYFIKRMGDESFIFDGTFWLPFDPNRPIGFFTAVLFQSALLYAEFNFIAPVISIFIGSCWSVVTFLKDVARDISRLKRKKIFNLRKEKLIERFCNFMRCHAEVEELSEQYFHNVMP